MLAPELVIRVGDMVTSKAVRTWLQGTEVPQVVFDPDGGVERADRDGRADRPGRPGDRCSRPSPSSSSRRADADWLKAWRATNDAAELEVDTFFTGLGDELFEPRVHRDLSALLPETAAPCTSPPACRSATSRRSCPPPAGRCASSPTAARTGSTG